MRLGMVYLETVVAVQVYAVFKLSFQLGRRTERLKTHSVFAFTKSFLLMSR